MHSSLTVQSTLIEIGACVLVAAGTLMLRGPFPGVPVAVAVAFGLVVGLLRGRSLAMAPQAYLRAHTSVEVRVAQMSTTSGRLAVIGQWIAIPLVVLSAWEGGNLLGGGLGGLAVFVAVRDLASLSGLLRLASESE